MWNKPYDKCGINLMINGSGTGCSAGRQGTRIYRLEEQGCMSTIKGTNTIFYLYTDTGMKKKIAKCN